MGLGSKFVYKTEKDVLKKANTTHILNVEKSIIERAMEYAKDRTENFDDYYPCRKRSDCNLNHAYRWFVLFVLLYNLSKLSFASSDANVFSLVTSRSKKMSIDQSAITLSFFSIVGRLAK